MTKRVFFALAVASILLAACNIGQTGSVALTLEPAEGVRAFLPAQPMTVLTYRVTLDGPSPYGPIEVSTGLVIDKLLPGDYDIAVDGLNAAGLTIAHGDATAEVVIGGSTEVSIVVVELVGTGGHSGTLHWQPDVVVDPVVIGAVKDSAGVSVPLVWTQDNPNCIATTGEAGKATGWYTLVMQVYDGTEAAGGLAAALRIVKDYTTTWETTATVNEATGGFDLDLSADMGDPLALTADVPAGAVEIQLGEALTITLDAPEAFTAVWYVNGVVALVDSPTFEIDTATMDPDLYYQISAVAFSVDGKHANDLQWHVVQTTTPPPPAYNDGDLVIRWSVPAGLAGQEYNYEVDHTGGVREREATGTLVAGPNEIVITGLPAAANYRVCLYVNTVWHYLTPLVIPTVGGEIADYGLLQ